MSLRQWRSCPCAGSATTRPVVGHAHGHAQEAEFAVHQGTGDWGDQQRSQPQRMVALLASSKTSLTCTRAQVGWSVCAKTPSLSSRREAATRRRRRRRRGGGGDGEEGGDGGRGQDGDGVGRYQNREQRLLRAVIRKSFRILEEKSDREMSEPIPRSSRAH